VTAGPTIAFRRVGADGRLVILYRRLGFRIVGEDEEKFKMRWDAEGSDRS
jgi:hypothetical protein